MLSTTFAGEAQSIGQHPDVQRLAENRGGRLVGIDTDAATAIIATSREHLFDAGPVAADRLLENRHLL